MGTKKTFELLGPAERAILDILWRHSPSALRQIQRHHRMAYTTLTTSSIRNAPILPATKAKRTELLRWPAFSMSSVRLGYRSFFVCSGVYTCTHRSATCRLKPDSWSRTRPF